MSCSRTQHSDSAGGESRTSNPSLMLYQLSHCIPGWLLTSNNKGADQTAWMCRLVCTFVVHTQQSQVFSLQAQSIPGFAQKQENSIPVLFQDYTRLFFIFQGLNFFSILYNTTRKCTFFSRKDEVEIQKNKKGALVFFDSNSSDKTRDYRTNWVE